MGFNKVYKALQEIFPEVDSRILRAVAIEHCKDADRAVEVVLSEVIPCLTVRNKPSSTSSGQSRVIVKSSEAAVDGNEALQTKAALRDNAEDSDELQDGLSSHETSCEHNKTADDDTDGESLQHFHDAVGGDHVAFEGDETGTPISKSNDEVNVHKSCLVSFLMSKDEDGAGGNVHEKCGQSLFNNDNCGQSACPEAPSYKVTKDSEAVVALDQLSLPTEYVDPHNTLTGTDSSACDDSSYFIHNSIHKEETLVDNQDKKHPERQLASLNVQTLTLSGSDSSIELVTTKEVPDFEPEKAELNVSDDATSNNDFAGDVIVSEMKLMPNPVVTASGQICSIDLLEDMMTEAKSNKKTLFSAMESVICLMKEAELQEEAAEQAKQEAAKGGLDMLKRVEDLKEMLRHAKEANDMHAGEVHGEKAILATEVKELQSRLLGLADERDKSLSVLDEMRQTLEVRIAAAEKELKAAEQERLGKEELARKALADEEVIMEKVVQESNILKQEAEENAKLRDFLVDRGRVVDTLQGEISVICQDVKLLKLKFDDRVPLSKSLSSSQTSCILASSSSSQTSCILASSSSSQTSCILASSSSSLKSGAPDKVPDPANIFDNPEEEEDASSYHEEELQLSGDVNADTFNKELLDDGWEFFDSRMLCV